MSDQKEKGVVEDDTLLCLLPGESFVHPDLRLRRSPVGGRGHFALKEIKKGEVLVIWRGREVDEVGLRQIPEDEQDYFLQLDDDRFQIATKFGRREAADFINHSCNPNGGMQGEATLIAMRTISPEEEITFDYSMAEAGDGILQIDCNCKTSLCRGIVSDQDWLKPELQERYRGYFSHYISKKIAALQTSSSSSSH